MPNLKKMQITIDFYGNLVIFVVGLLNNWLVKVAETFTDILNYYVLQTTANKFAVHVKVYVVKKYLNSELEQICLGFNSELEQSYQSKPFTLDDGDKVEKHTSSPCYIGLISAGAIDHSKHSRLSLNSIVGGGADVKK